MKKSPLSEAEIRAKTTDLAQRLEENSENAIQTIERIISVMGEEFAEDYYEKTISRQSTGGLSTLDKRRLRTKGGIFFYLVKSALNEKLKSQIFPESETQKEKEPKAKKISAFSSSKIEMIESNLTGLRANETKLLGQGRDASLTQTLIRRTEQLLREAKNSSP